MKAQLRFWVVLALSASVLGHAREGKAQQQQSANPAVSGYQPQQPLAVQMYGSGMMNPYMNPYIMGSQGNSDFLLYMYAKNQQAGGIGSGVISGTRPAPGVPAGSTPAAGRPAAAPSPFSRNNSPGANPAPPKTTALMPSNVMSPAANTGGYYQRGPAATRGAGRYFNRTQPARAQNNGR